MTLMRAPQTPGTPLCKPRFHMHWTPTKMICDASFVTSVLSCFFIILGLARNTSALLSATVACNRQHTRNNKMSSSPAVNTTKSVCAKCGRPSSQTRQPLVKCSQCRRLFHTTCLIKSYAGKKQYLSCADCKEKYMNASMREGQQSRQSSTMTSKTNARQFAGSGVAISASRKGGNSNKPQLKRPRTKQYLWPPVHDGLAGCRLLHNQHQDLVALLVM